MDIARHLSTFEYSFFHTPKFVKTRSFAQITKRVIIELFQVKNISAMSAYESYTEILRIKRRTEFSRIFDKPQATRYLSCYYPPQS